MIAPSFSAVLSCLRRLRSIAWRRWRLQGAAMMISGASANGPRTINPPRADRQSANLWACHRAFHEPGDDCENGAAGAAARDLTEERA
jgi:hypothetical protein